MTSTYLKSLYGITAPFVDTRFNEQIALYLYNGGKAFGHDDYNCWVEKLRRSACLAKGKREYHESGQCVLLYFRLFPIRAKGEDTYVHEPFAWRDEYSFAGVSRVEGSGLLETAYSIQTAIAKDKKKWIRPDGDIWYKISPEYEFIGRDYVHLTLEDLIHSYESGPPSIRKMLPVFEEMIRSKAGYLNKNKLGYTTKIKKGLERIDMLELLPAGTEHTDAL